MFSYFPHICLCDLLFSVCLSVRLFSCLVVLFLWFVILFVFFDSVIDKLFVGLP